MEENPKNIPDKEKFNSIKSASSHTDLLINTYNEVCKSYHAIDNFRMQLLGLLPLFSVVGFFFIDHSEVQKGNELISFVSLFAALFTAALFAYEIRGIFRCNKLMQIGKSLEKEMDIKGQFGACIEQSKESTGAEKLFDAKFAACLTYMLVIAGWLYVFLLYSIFQDEVWMCAVLASIVGIVLAIISYVLIRKAVAS